MRILDSDTIPLGVSKSFVRLPNEEDEDFYYRLSHLHSSNKKLEEIGDLSLVKNLTVLYLYDNNIKRIQKLDAVPHLSMLYLQNNRISRIENLGALKKLKKLYLSRNQIAVIEGLHDLENLEELHVNHQNVDADTGVVFDPRTTKGLKSLKILNSSNNHMKTLSSLENFRSLFNLNISSNAICHKEDTLQALSSLTGLQELDVNDNPVMKERHFKDDVVASCRTLKTLNGKEIYLDSRMMLTILRRRNRRKSDNLSASNKD